MANEIVSVLLRSPFHRALSAKLDVVRYRGLKSGRQFSTPTQYVRRDNDILILVGKPNTKTWWRNFRDEHDLDVLLSGTWVPMTGRAVIGADDPDVARSLLDRYVEVFPKAARAIDGETADDRARQTVIVWCRPRRANTTSEASE